MCHALAARSGGDGRGTHSGFGKIPAGRLADVLQDCETIIEPNELLPYRPGDFLLVVEGDSMIGDGILPGDKVLLRPNLHPHEGEIAAVQVGDEYYASLKHIHFSRSRGIVILRASNPTYDDVRVPASHVRIAGVYRGLVREQSVGVTMGFNSKIEWTTHTFNPWWGCTKVSDGCKFCYAEALSKRYGHRVWGPRAPRRLMSDDHWKGPLRWDTQASRQRMRSQVFWCFYG